MPPREERRALPRDDVRAWVGNPADPFGQGAAPEPPDWRHREGPHAALGPKDYLTSTRVGLVMGRFRPPHLGHMLLVEHAFARCGWLHVVTPRVPWERDRDFLFTSALHGAFGEWADVHALDAPEAARDVAAWAHVVRTLSPAPTDLFSSDPRAEALAAALGIRHHLVDVERRAVPLSATAIRADLVGRFGDIAPGARAALSITVALVGAEGAGKSTLARELAILFDAPLVEDTLRKARPRRADGSRGRPDARELADAVFGANERLAAVAREARSALVFDDDSAFVAAHWAERLGAAFAPASVADHFAKLRTQPPRRALWLFCGDDFYDGDDDELTDAARRRAFRDRLRAALVAAGAPIFDVTGEGRERVERAAAAVRDARAAHLARVLAVLS